MELLSAYAQVAPDSYNMTAYEEIADDWAFSFHDSGDLGHFGLGALHENNIEDPTKPDEMNKRKLLCPFWQYSVRPFVFPQRKCLLPQELP